MHVCTNTMVAFFVFCTSFTRRAISFSTRSAVPTLSSRLQRLIEFVPADEQISSVADIGCDHGYVARALAEQRHNVQCVFAIDKSHAALKSARESELPVGVKHPSFLLGDGLTPLMPSEQPLSTHTHVNTIICAGMGCKSVHDVLDPDKLEALGVQRLILQPWPAYLLSWSRLTSHVLNLGYVYERQCVDFEKGEFYITTAFKKRTGVEGSALPVDEIAAFKCSPLYIAYAQSPCSGADALEGEGRRWLEYLAMQMGDLEVRLSNGGGTRRADDTVVKSYHSLLTQLTTSLAPSPIPRPASASAAARRKDTGGSSTALCAVASSSAEPASTMPDTPSVATPDPWYKTKGGLQFSCSLCGNCCSGSTGSVTFTSSEAISMAAKLGVTEAEFYSKYTRKRGRGLNGYHELKEVKVVAPNKGTTYDCVFLDRQSMPGKAICKLYKERPLQCKTWPFWPDIIENEQTWKLAQKGVEGCPGIGKGEIVPYEEVVRMRDNSGL